MPEARAVLEHTELIALALSWQIAIVRTKSMGFTPKTSELRKMANLHLVRPAPTPAAVSSSRPAAPPPITTIQGEDGR
jgi:hypothetical protein